MTDVLIYNLAAVVAIYTLFSVIFWAAKRLLAQFIHTRCETQLSRHYAQQWLKLISTPLFKFWSLIALVLAAFLIGISEPWQSLGMNSLASIAILFFAQSCYRSAHYVHCNLDTTQKIIQQTPLPAEKTLIEFGSHLAKILVILLSILFILQVWGIYVSTLIAGLGLIGLAVSLAGKSLISNLLGGILIYLDKPFSLGDWIESTHGQGVVENIGFRSTQVRTFADALITIPNSALSEASLINWSRMKKRRVHLTLHVTHGPNPRSVQNLIADFTHHLRTHPDVDQEQIMVHLERIDSRGHALFIYFFTKTVVWGDYLKVRESLFLELMSMVEKNHARLALPKYHLIQKQY